MSRLQLAALFGVLAGCTRGVPTAPAGLPASASTVVEPCSDFHAWVCTQDPPVLPTVAQRREHWKSAPAVELAYQVSETLAEHHQQCLTGPVGDVDAALAPWLRELQAVQTGANLLALSGRLEAAGLPGLFRLVASPEGPTLVPSNLVQLTDVAPDGRAMPRGGWRGVELHIRLASSELAQPLDPQLVRSGLLLTSTTHASGQALPLAEARRVQPLLTEWAEGRGVAAGHAITVSPAALALAERSVQSLPAVVQALRFALWARLGGLGEQAIHLQSATLEAIWAQGVGLDDIFTSEQRCAALLSDQLDVARAQAVLTQSGLRLSELTEQVRARYGAHVDAQLAHHNDPELVEQQRALLEQTQVFVGAPAGAVALPSLGADRVASQLLRLRAQADHRLKFGHRDGPDAMFASCAADVVRNSIHCGLPALLPFGPSTDGRAPEVVAVLSEMLAHEWTHLLDWQRNSGRAPQHGAASPEFARLLGASACLAVEPERAMTAAGQPTAELQQVWSEAHADHMGLRVGLEAWRQLGFHDDPLFFAAVASSSCDAPAVPGGSYLPATQRVNRAMAVSAAFRQAYECSPSARLAQEPVCELW